MGEVFRAWDRTSGEPVAIKLLRAGQVDRGRFEREARVLADLHHPGIVRYVAHGVAASGEQFLAIEWLEGEDLSRRLERGSLTTIETVTLATRVAEALSAAHGDGVVHRDLKPSNLFLVAGDVALVKVLDFGIAWLGGEARVTETGTMLGTPGYMAPEQVRSGQAVDARADVFALGCVLFECLTGKPAFSGDHVMAVLGKVLFEEAPRILDLDPELPAALDALVARMLAKRPDERPENGAAVAAALAELGGAELSQAAPERIEPAPPSALTRSEQRVLSVVMQRRGRSSREVATLVEERERLSRNMTMRTVAEARGGHLEMLIDGSAMVTIVGATRIATDLAAHAARCALSLHEHCPDRAIALATGRGDLTGKLPAGDVIDRATELLGRTGLVGLGTIAIDNVTAGLLDARFEVVETSDGFDLRGEHEIAAGARTLLGKPTACVGRDWELMMLEELVTECISEPRSRPVLVTAPAGLGKSRLAHELMLRLRRREEGIHIWFGRGDALRTGSAFGLLGQVLRGVFALQQGEPLEAQRSKLCARVEQHVTAADARRIWEFLGELLGTPFPGEESVPLRAARLDAQIMGDQLRWAFVDLLRAETSIHPVLMVLEDLHWGDLPTVQFIDAALRELGDRPWMVLGLARPEVHDLFPKLWSARNVQEIRLKELSRKASEVLVRQVLGDSVGKETVDRIVKQANGHAFYLEELIRASSERHGEALPETVLAMLEARLAGLDGEARRVLRAASVFGATFWGGGVSDLLAAEPSAVDPRLRELVEREIVERSRTSRVAGEVEYAFRHTLVRDAAYAMLTDADRSLGHRLAGDWLERVGQTDPVVLAEHFDRGGQPDRAVGWYRRGAEQALEGNDLAQTIARAERAIACGPDGPTQGALEHLLSEAHYFSGDLTRAVALAETAATRLAAGSEAWFQAVAALIQASGQRGQNDVVEAWALAAAGMKAAPGALTAQIVCLWRGASQLLWAHRASAAALVEQISELAPDPGALAPQAAGRAHRVLADTAYLQGRLDVAAREFEAASAAFERAGATRDACVTRIQWGCMVALWGEPEAGEPIMRRAIADAERLGIRYLTYFGRGPLGLALLYKGQYDLAEQALVSALEGIKGSARFEADMRTFAAIAYHATGRFDRAEREARAASDLPLSHAQRAGVLGVLARAIAAQGRPHEALPLARTAVSLRQMNGGFEALTDFAELSLGETLDALGQREAAREVIRAAVDRLQGVASKLESATRREKFLERPHPNREIMGLARAWGVIS